MHHAFGDGPHKCIGMHLAKLEVKIVLEEFAKRVEAFSITDESKISAHGGTTMGMDNLPITWTA
jgi:cytochrome P450